MKKVLALSLLFWALFNFTGLSSLWAEEKKTKDSNATTQEEPKKGKVKKKREIGC